MDTTYKFVLTGITTALMHADDIERADELKAYRKHSDNKQSGVAGDDRSPAWTWQTYVYTDGERIVAPADNIMACLRKAGCQVTVSGKKTFKQITQSGMAILNDYCEFEGGNGPIYMRDIEALRDLPFAAQAQGVKPLGFNLLAKRAKVGMAKHVRVRAAFYDWRIIGQIAIFDSSLTKDIVSNIFEIAGNSVGLFDWRPSSPTSPGPYGRFHASLSEVKPDNKKSR